MSVQLKTLPFLLNEQALSNGQTPLLSVSVALFLSVVVAAVVVAVVAVAVAVAAVVVAAVVVAAVVVAVAAVVADRKSVV